VVNLRCIREVLTRVVNLRCIREVYTRVVNLRVYKEDIYPGGEPQGVQQWYIPGYTSGGRYPGIPQVVHTRVSFRCIMVVHTRVSLRCV